MLNIRIFTDTPAFRGNKDEIARQLRRLASLFADGLPEETCYSQFKDSCGNLCGRWSYQVQEVTDAHNTTSDQQQRQPSVQSGG